ncbi:hypothetical protein CERZMDRAFT_87110 [Cercospora zeae-maydis SCOH1-5]|uniref:Uncharacterized protein n=1 Tax=Cercospora zeae-maydis SCOH1-5 TaxID=717836 RepID=A0A6A6F8A7_9PEZI|nr:hypothetical protein CERZMDRAFT_87110 [Cercospora zeae-maydis SCOH1-5]
MSASIFNRLEGSDQFIEVGMNEVDILLPESRKVAIRTQNLNECTSIVVLGRATILAHVSPMSTSGTKSAEEHHKERLTAIDDMYAKHRGLFPSDTTTWGVFAKYKGEPMDHIVTQVNNHLSQKGLPVQPAFYNVAKAHTRAAPAGQLVAIVGQHSTELYLED